MLPEVNLLPSYERFESRLYYLFIVGLILLLIAIGMLTYFYFSTASDLKETDMRVSNFENEKITLETRLQSIQTDIEIPSMREAVAYVESYQLPTSKLVDEFIRLLPENAYLSSYDFNYHSVTIQTQFESLPATSTYVADLTASPYLNEVYINEIGTFTNEGVTEGENVTGFDPRYAVLPRYDVSYSMEVDRRNLKREEESDETAISGE